MRQIYKELDFSSLKMVSSLRPPLSKPMATLLMGAIVGFLGISWWTFLFGLNWIVHLQIALMHRVEERRERTAP